MRNFFDRHGWAVCLILFITGPAIAGVDRPAPFDISEFGGTLAELEALIPGNGAPEPAAPSSVVSAFADRPAGGIENDNPVGARGFGAGPLCEDPSTSVNARPRLLLERYWSSRQALREHFIRNAMDADGNLTGDGIGVWDAQKQRYSYAGYGFPLAQMVMTHTPPGGTGRPNYFRNGDMPLNLGRSIALLASEYELLGRSGQFKAQKKTLNELFLALQAYRRIDMTANRLWKLRQDACGGSCGWQPDLSGFSGWFIRDDIPGDFHALFPANQPAHWQVGATESDYTGGFNGFPCDDFPAPLSQDQVIGMLHGLAFVKKFIPPETRVSVNGATYNLLEMAGNIAYGMVNRIRQADGHKIRYPACSNAKVERGPDANWLLYGMIQAANTILPPERHIAGSVGISLEWAAARRGILLTNGWGNPDNVRMLVELIAASNTNYTGAVRKAAHDMFWMQHFGWAVMYDESLADEDLAHMACILCDYRCPGPCSQTSYYSAANVGPPFACANLDPAPGNVDGGGCRVWCRDFWKRGFDCNQGFHGMKQPGVSYMLAYNLFHLAGGTAYGHYYDPSRIESSNMLADAELDLSGPASVFPGQEIQFQVVSGVDAAYIWGVSPKLAITWTEPGTGRKARVRALPGTTGEAFVEAADESITQSSECRRPPRVRKTIWINQPPPLNPVINGSLPGMVATQGGDFCDRCVVNPENQVDDYLVTSPNYVMGYRSGKNDCSVWAPYDGYYLNHRQGIQR